MGGGGPPSAAQWPAVGKPDLTQRVKLGSGRWLSTGPRSSGEGMGV